MTWPLVIMRVNRSTYEDIKRRVIEADQADRILDRGRISVDELAIEVDPASVPFEKERLTRALYDEMEGTINNQDAKRQEQQWKLAERLAGIAISMIHKGE